MQEFLDCDNQVLSLIINYPKFLETTIIKDEYLEPRARTLFNILKIEYSKYKEFIIENLVKHNNFDISYYAELLNNNLYYSSREIKFNEFEKYLIDRYKTKQYEKAVREYNNNPKELYNKLTKLNDINYNENEYITAIDMYNTLEKQDEIIKIGYPILDSSLNLSKHDLLILAAGTGCVDCDTEYFNGYEWKKISDFNNNDKILQYDPKTKKAILLKPLKYHKIKEERLNYIKTSKGLDMCLSDEHNVYYLDGNNNLKNITCEKMINIHNKNKKGFSGKFITSFEYGSKGIDLSDNDIKLMCAIICDGSFDRRRETNRCYINLKKERKIIELENILQEGKHEYKKTKKKNGFTLFSFSAPRKEKEFSDYWYNCSNNQLRLICENILKWDGCEKNGRKAFSSSNKKTATFVQFAFSSCGFRARMSVRNRIGRIRIIEGKKYETKSLEYLVNISKNNTTSLKSTTKIKIVDYNTKDGYKYCFTTYTGLWVMRRNGCICITGNCGKTAFALNLLMNLSKDYQCIYFNQEMGENILHRRLTAITTGIDIRKLRNINNLEVEEINKLNFALDEIDNRKIILVNKAITMKEIETRISNIKTDRHIIAFIDHIGLIKGSGRSLYEKMTEIAKELRRISINYDCTIIGLCQLSREAQKENKIPTLQDLRDSGEIEQSARKVIFLYNENPNENQIQDMQIIIGKNDDGDKKIKAFKFDKYRQKFEEVYNGGK